MTTIVFMHGKGGVGATVLAAATACVLAADDSTVLGTGGSRKWNDLDTVMGLPAPVDQCHEVHENLEISRGFFDHELATHVVVDMPCGESGYAVPEEVTPLGVLVVTNDYLSVTATVRWLHTLVLNGGVPPSLVAVGMRSTGALGGTDVAEVFGIEVVEVLWTPMVGRVVDAGLLSQTRHANRMLEWAIGRILDKVPS